MRVRGIRRGQGASDGAAMTFDEIAKETGTSQANVFQAYKSAIEKLRKSGQMRLLRELVKAKESEG